MIKMASASVETICFQDDFRVILNTSLELETYIKGHDVYKEVWTPEVGEKLNVMMEPDNRVDKFAVCVEKIRQSLVIWKKEALESSQRRFFTSSEVISTVTPMLKSQGNDGTWKMEKGYKSLVKCKYIKTWITKNQWTMMTKILVIYFSMQKKF